jgi:hypothetical protein
LAAPAELAATAQLSTPQSRGHKRHIDWHFSGAEHLLSGNPFRPARLATGCFQIKRHLFYHRLKTSMGAIGHIPSSAGKTVQKR